MTKQIKAGHLFSHSANRFADHVAIVDKEKKLTFAEVSRRVNRLTHGLMSLGVQKGDRIAQLMYNCSEYVEVHFAVWTCGTVRVPLNIRGSKQEIIDWLNDSESETLIFSAEVADLVRSIRGHVCTKNFVRVGNENTDEFIPYEQLIALSSEQEIDVTVLLEDPCRLQYTSGTTGKLKAAVITYDSEIYINELYLLNSEIKLTENDAMLLVTPMSHASGLYSVRMFMVGAKQVILDKFDPKSVLQSIQEEKITVAFFVPTMIYNLLDYTGVTNFDLSSVRLIEYGASPMATEKLKQAIGLFGNVFSQWYGLSEAPAFVLRLNRNDHLQGVQEAETAHRLMAAGRIDYGPEVRLVDLNGNDVPVGVEGEIIIRGRQVMKEYWRAPGLTQQTVVYGWLHTGDIARMDADGYVYIVGRNKDLIISGGFNIYPREIEEILHQHPSVGEAAVIGIPDPYWGEAVKAFVVRKDVCIDEEILIAYCRENLPKYKVPKSVDFLEEIPKNNYGKVQKNVLREPYWVGKERRVN